MPELPEVETIRRQLAPHMEGATLSSVEVIDPLWCKPLLPAEMEDALKGARIKRLERRGKYLVVVLNGGAGGSDTEERFLVMHLRMTGNLGLSGDKPADAKHLRAVFGLDSGGYVFFTDLRRFGHGLIVEDGAALDGYFNDRLGMEPFGDDFTDDYLAESVRGRSRPIKALLLDQKFVAGVGNIYADEALFCASIHPLQPAGTLNTPEISRLRKAVLDRLEKGLENDGATTSDFRHTDGASGTMQDEFLVHRRKGKPCPNCGTEIVKLQAAGRGTYICPSCQKLRKRKVRGKR